MRQVHVSRPEENSFSAAAKSQTKPTVPPHKSDPRDLAEFDRIASRGEQLDPNNAFFSAIRAVGLFGALNDKEALESVKRAASKHEWNDYVNDEIEGRIRLMDAARGHRGAFYNAVQGASILFPHYAQIRAVARMAAYHAIEAEKTGHTEEGISIRHSMLRIAGLMRAKSTTLIGSLVGIAIAQIALARTGGTPAVKSDAELSADERARVRLDRYCAFVQKAGRPDEAEFAKKELTSALRAREVAKLGIDLSPIGGQPIFRLVAKWFGDSLLLANVLWFIVFGVVALVIMRLRSGSSALPFCLAITMLGVLAILTWNSRWSEAVVTYYQVIQNLTGSEQNFGVPLPMIRVGTVALALVFPLIFVMSALIVAAANKAPVAAGFARGSSVVALVLTVIYAGSAIATTSQDNNLGRAIKQSMKGEGRYLAGALHKDWPEPPT